MENQGNQQERYNTLKHIDFLISLVSEANNVPFTDKCAIERDLFISELEKLKNRLPVAVAQSNDIVARAQEVIQTARDKGNTIRMEADRIYAERVNEHEITKGAKAQADQILRDANRQAEELRKSAHIYVKEILENANEMLAQCSAKIQTNITEIDTTIYGE